MPRFTHPELLALLVGLVPFVFVIWRQHAGSSLRARLSLLTRVAIVTLLVLGLAGFTIEQPVGRQAVVFVADLSASVEDARAEQATFIQQALEARGPDDA